MKTKLFKLLSFVLLSVLILFSCENFDFGAKDASGGEGTGGSMARFTIVNDHLYTVDNRDLKVFDIRQPETPVFRVEKAVGVDVETIFPLDSLLFLGTSSGMYIYDVSTPVIPRQLTYYEHVVSCDPVVSDGDYAYVTLRTGNQRCWRGVNELQIIDLENIQNPFLLKSYPMEKPRGLAIKNDTLWVCDDGIKVYNSTNKNAIEELFHFNDILAYDIILVENRALVIGETGFIQYQLEDGSLKKLSEIIVGF